MATPRKRHLDKRSNVEEKILEALAEHGQMQVRELAEHIGYSEGYTKERLCLMRHSGEVTQQNNGLHVYWSALVKKELANA